MKCNRNDFSEFELLTCDCKYDSICTNHVGCPLQIASDREEGTPEALGSNQNWTA